MQQLEQNISMQYKKPSIIRNFYNWCIENANAKKAKYYLYAFSFAESSFFPIPPDVLFIPMMIANPKPAFRMAFWMTFYSVIGGIVGYSIGYYLYNSLGAWIIDTYNMHASFLKFQESFDQYGFWIIALKGLTPIPYKLVTIASGFAKIDLTIFIIASIIARGFRFYLLAALLYFCGDKARVYIEKYLTLALLLTLGIILIGFIIIRFLA